MTDATPTPPPLDRHSPPIAMAIPEESASSATPSPVGARERIASIDVLRGVAILGILVMNIQSFAMPISAYSYPWSWGDMTGANGAVWLGGHVLAAGKFISIFAMLFGAGIVLREDRGSLGSTAKLHYRRMLVLLGIGLLHAYLLWYGDILFSYALLGMVIFLLRKIPAIWLAVMGAALYAGGVVFNLGLGALMSIVPEESIAEAARGFNPPYERQLAEVAAYQGSWLAQMPQRMTTAIFAQTGVLLIYTLPFVGGMMLAGMALMKSGFFAAAWQRTHYLAIALAGCLIGWSISAAGLWMDAEDGRDPIRSVMFYFHINSIAMPFVAIGYSAAVMAICHSGVPGFAKPFAAVGRTALSCYLLTTLICTTIFYGHGFGLFGRVDRVGQLGITIGVWVVLLIAASLWLRRFRFGPAEWLWRSLSYGRSKL